MNMKVSVKPDTCAGHCRCQIVCPEVFSADELGYVELLMTEIPPRLHAAALEAASGCPEGALVIES
jgi:ferredoxin